tara:strand:- start:740 stop:1441 length:702 start_codon:yes stop_codon:yes gene_type:complete
MNKFLNVNYLNYRLHHLFNFEQIISRGNFKFLINKKIIPIYNLKGLILNFNKHEIDEIKLINKYILTYNTLELGCSIGVTSLNIKNKIKKMKLISIDGNSDAIKYCKILNKLNKFDIEFMHHVIGNKNLFSTNSKNFLSSKSELNFDPKEANDSIMFIQSLIDKEDIKSLVIDIEGMEKNILQYLNLDNIRQIFIELHPMIYSLSDEKCIIDQLIQRSFALVEKVNNNYYFEK